MVPPMAGLPQEHPKPSYGTLLLKLWSPYPPPHPSHPLPSCWRQGRAGGEPWGGGGSSPLPLPTHNLPPQVLLPQGRCWGRAQPHLSACSIPGTGHRVPTGQGVSGHSPLPINDTKPSFAASAVVYWCGSPESPPQQGGRRWRGGTPRAPVPAAGTDFQPH